MTLLEIKNINRSFGGLHAVNDVSFEVAAGSITAVIGPNGAGKTTIFNLVSGALRPDSGGIYIGGVPIHGCGPHLISKKGIARTFQNIKLFSRMTVLENVMVGMHTRSGYGFISGMFSLPKTWREERRIRGKALAVLDVFGIADLADSDAASLPFGRQRIVECARALASEPRLLLLDEPAAGLNIHETEKMAKLISEIRGRGITVLLIEHDMSLVMDISEKVVVLSSGKKIAEGKPVEIQKNREVIRNYLGEDDA